MAVYPFNMNIGSGCSELFQIIFIFYRVSVTEFPTFPSPIIHPLGHTVYYKLGVCFNVKFVDPCIVDKIIQKDSLPPIIKLRKMFDTPASLAFNIALSAACISAVLLVFRFPATGSEIFLKN